MTAASKDGIQLLQFFICKEFQTQKHDSYLGEAILSNLYVPSFPYHFDKIFAVTCWRKDKKFHKEIIEYETEDGKKAKSAHMDIEPVTSSVLFRWHKHRFPTSLVVLKPTYLTIRVILDWKVLWESYILIEQKTQV